jgi:Type IV secretory pathway, VirD4 components
MTTKFKTYDKEDLEKIKARTAENETSRKKQHKDSRYVRWEDDDVYKGSFSRLDLKEGSKMKNSGGMPMYYDGQFAGVEDRDVHTLIFGSTGSKKTRLCILPTLYTLAISGESFIATDTKGELYDRLADTLKANGYKTVVLNFRDPQSGNCWNPLDLPYMYYQDPGTKDLGREMMADLAANIIPISSADPYWDLSARNTLNGFTEMVFRNCASPEEVNMKSVCRLKAESLNGDLSDIKEYLSKIRTTSQTEFSNLSGIAHLTADTTRSCISSIFDTHTQIFSTNDSMSQMMSRTDFDVETIGFEKTAVFLMIPDEKTTYNKLLSIFIKQVYEKMITEANKTETNTLPIRVNYVLDEFGNIPTITGFPSMISAARSRNIRFFLAVQTIAQITSHYPLDSEVIRSNCNNHVYLYSNDLYTLEKMSKLAGTKKNGEPLVTISMLQHLSKEKGEAYVICGERRLFPYITTLRDIDEILPFKKKEPIQKLNPKPVKTLSFRACRYGKGPDASSSFF